MMEVKGNGNIVSKEFNVSTYLRLHLACKGAIELIQGDEEKVVVEADENLISYFSAMNAGRTLFVTAEGKLKNPVFTSCLVKVFFRQLNVLYVRNDHGDVRCAREITLQDPLEVKIQSIGNTELWLNVPSIKLLSQTQGNILLRGKTAKLEIKNQSEGNFDSTQMTAGDLSIKNMAAGNIDLHAENSITISHYGEGYIHYSGNAIVKDVKQYGRGEIKRIER